MITTMQFDAKSLEMRLGGLYGRLHDLRPVWGDIHEIFLAFMKRVFDAEGKVAKGGSAWAPLNPRYAAWKRRTHGDLPILYLRGGLRRSFTEAGGAEHIYRTGPAFMEVGSSVEYARAHQWGYPPKKLPARPILRAFTKAEGARAADAVLAHLLKSMRRTGGR
jgi:phage gpG-like protein